MASLVGKESEDTALESRGYTLGKKLGQGSYAKVRMADYRSGDRVEKLACKIVDKNLAPKDFLSKFFPRELDIIPKMDHPSVIRVHSILERSMKVSIREAIHTSKKTHDFHEPNVIGRHESFNKVCRDRGGRTYLIMSNNPF